MRNFLEARKTLVAFILVFIVGFMVVSYLLGQIGCFSCFGCINCDETCNVFDCYTSTAMGCTNCIGGLVGCE